MQYRQLGKSGPEVSVIAFGAWQLGDPGYWGDDAAVDAEATVQEALDHGVNLFDTAEMYGGGHAEEVLGKALGTRRDDILIASKFIPGHARPERLRKACEESLKRLGTDRIDLYQVHWPFRDVPFAEAFGELRRLREEGKIRYIGLSNFGPRDLDAWMTAGDAVSNQLGYNLLSRAIEYTIVPACSAHGLGVLAYMPLLQGILAGRWYAIGDIPEKRRRTRHFASGRPGTRHGEPGCETELAAALDGIAAIARELGKPMATVALAWLLAQPGIGSVLVGGRKPGQFVRNLEAIDTPLSADVLERLDGVTRPVKVALGSNADLWQSDSEARIH